ncbi:MAG TPA: 2-phosphosulfolactate phosphatase, partial [Deinococcales bacterium]|nr:2-phosphosulfolactate phosphatase [Deinococcales bacterium]
MGGRTVVAGCLRNAAAVAAFLRRFERPVLVLAAGEQTPGGPPRPALEDRLGAGAILAGLPGAWLSTPARAAAAAFRSAEDRLHARLAWSASGRELRARGFALDVRLAAQLNAGRAVPVLVEGAYRAAVER